MIYLIEHTENIADELVKQVFDRLPPQRRERVSRYLREEDRRQGTLVWLLLLHALREEYGIVFNGDPAIADNGKPFFPRYPELHFNLSHCSGAVACALSRHPVGIDVERQRQIEDNLLRFVLSPAEYAAVAAAESRDKRFLYYWTRKEALLKLDGSGLRRELKPLLEASADRVDFLTREYADGLLLSVCAARGELPDKPICLCRPDEGWLR